MTMSAVKRFARKFLPAGVVNRLQGWRIRRVIRQFPARVVEHRYGRTSLRVNLTDPLAEQWYDHDWPDLPELEVLREGRLKPGARVFDCGAHQGVVALMLAHEVGPAGSVVAIEANPHNAELARQNAELNRRAQVEVVQAAVAARPGTLTLNQRLNGQLDDGTSLGGRLTVPSTTIDDLALQHGHPDVVFLDIEGAEVMALQGATEVLRQGPDFFVEVHVGRGLERLGGTPDALVERFEKAGYSLEVRKEAEPAFRPLESSATLNERCYVYAHR